MGHKTLLAALTLLLLSGSFHTLQARPEFLMLFQNDPLRLASVDGCSTCHINPLGGGSRNEFGLAFAGNGFVITPMLRAGFPDRFDVPSTRLDNGTVLYFSDPDSESVVMERGEERYLIDLEAVVSGRASAPSAPEREFSFFVTSTGPGSGANLGAIAGADRHCQSLATAVGSGNKTWRGYLSTSINGRAVINAGDRIGAGPWFNIEGIRVARGVSDLHSENNNFNADTVLTETGTRPELHDILTGTLMDGTASDATCENWTSTSTGSALLGHFDRQGGGDFPTSWNAAHLSRGCGQDDLRGTGGDGLFYCFAID